MHSPELADILKSRRKALGITQSELAEFANISLRGLKAIEVGEGNPTLETLNKLAEVLGLELKLEVRKLEI